MLRLPQAHFRSQRLGNGVQLLVGGIMADDMVSWTDKRVIEQKIGLDRSGRDQDILLGQRRGRLDGVQVGQMATKLIRTPDGAIGEFPRREREGVDRFFRREVPQVVNGDRGATRLCDVVCGARLVLFHPLCIDQSGAAGNSLWGRGTGLIGIIIIVRTCSTAKGSIFTMAVVREGACTEANGNNHAVVNSPGLILSIEYYFPPVSIACFPSSPKRALLVTCHPHREITCLRSGTLSASPQLKPVR